ncbi:MAG: HEAT repeat domain-containing protein [gamma proteobacterium endosymbiont of Lamellibrachia anaximandri]|nr:HEAT repeat domain-containing protein [gamma proteobacterium endosymbiont of Lamellibrachia anaximandri]MBL3619342.1 HEAT repeat domain-containing protein [gamma proteobacterium endosymbiont of Lamellibrachia anaximandri]
MIIGEPIDFIRIGNSGDPHAVGLLISVLDNVHSGSDCRRNAAKALAKLGEQCAVDPLVNFICDESSFDSDIARAAAAEVLGELGEKRAVEPLINFVLWRNGDDKWLRCSNEKG